jgi:ketosteroid isomerase-like protein
MMSELEYETAATLAAVERFNEAFNRHDVDAIMATLTDDCIFENTNPFPDGARYEGHGAVREVWVKVFHGSSTAHFESEEIFASGSRCVVSWVYRKTKEGKPWHLRGIDLFRVREGKIAETLSYDKG